MPAAAAVVADVIGSSLVADVGIGALVGGGVSALTGGNFLKGALEGGLTGGVADVLPSVGSAIGEGISGATGLTTGINAIGEGLAGAAAGAGEAALFGQNLLTGAITGGVGGAVQGSGILNGIGGSSGGSAPSTGAAKSAGGGGGFQSPSSLLSDSNKDVLDQLGSTSSNLSSASIPGSGTGTSTSLGTLGGIDNSGSLELGGGSNFGSQGTPGLPSTSQAGSVSSGLETGGFLSPSSSSSSSTGLESGGFLSPSSTGASSVADTSSSSSGFGQKALDFLGSNAKYALPIGELAKTLIDGPAKLSPDLQALQSGGAVTGPLMSLEQQQLQAYNSGTLTPAQQAQIDQYTQQAQNQLYQQLAGSGVTNPNQDSRFIQGMQQIQQQAQVMKQQILQQDLAAGTGAAGQAANNLSGVASYQNKQDEEYQQAIEAAINSFAAMSGRGSLSSIESLLGG